MTRAVRSLLIPLRCNQTAVASGQKVRTCHLSVGYSDRAEICFRRTQTPADLRGALTQSDQYKRLILPNQQTRSSSCQALCRTRPSTTIVQPAYFYKQRRSYCLGTRSAQTHGSRLYPRRDESRLFDQQRESHSQSNQIRSSLSDRPTLRSRETNQFLHFDLLRGLRHLRRKRRDDDRQ